MHAQLEASQAAFGHLCEEHQRLQDLRRHEERVKLFELFRRQMLSKNEQLGSLQADVSAAQQRLQEAQAAAAQRETQLQQGFEQERQQLGAQVAVLQAQLQGLQQFQQDKEGLEAELARLRQENAQITEDSGEKVW
jgi:chromosome segregation ATPase